MAKFERHDAQVYRSRKGDGFDVVCQTSKCRYSLQDVRSLVAPDDTEANYRLAVAEAARHSEPRFR